MRPKNLGTPLSTRYNATFECVGLISAQKKGFSETLSYYKTKMARGMKQLRNEINNKFIEKEGRIFFHEKLNTDCDHHVLYMNNVEEAFSNLNQSFQLKDEYVKTSYSKIKEYNVKKEKFDKLPASSPIKRKISVHQRLSSHSYRLERTAALDFDCVSNLLSINSYDLLARTSSLDKSISAKLGKFFFKDKAHCVFPDGKSDVLIYDVERTETFGKAETERLLAVSSAFGYELVMIRGSVQSISTRPNLDCVIARVKCTLYATNNYAENEIKKIRRALNSNTKDPSKGSGSRGKTSIDFTSIGDQGTCFTSGLNFMRNLKETSTTAAGVVVDLVTSVVKTSREFVCRMFYPAIMSKIEVNEYFDDVGNISSPKVYNISRAGSNGFGFYYRNCFVAPHHITKGKDIYAGDKLLKCEHSDAQSDVDYFISSPPKDFFKKVNKGDVVIIHDGANLVPGVVLSSNPQQIYFDGEPRQGLSGLPIFAKQQRGSDKVEIVGVYSMHWSYKNPLCHVTVTNQEKWTSKVSRELEKKDLMLSVPCGMGKSTFLVSELTKRYERICMIEPRVAITQAIARNHGWKSLSGDDEIDLSVDNVIVSHGKLAGMLMKDDKFILGFDLIIIDECHEKSEYMFFIMHTLATMTSPKPRILAMTATPSNEKYLQYSRGISRRPRKFVSLNDIKKQEPKQMMESLKANCSHGKTLIQVPNSTYSQALEQQISNAFKDSLVVTINRRMLSSKTLSEILEPSRAADHVFFLCTSVVAFGVTLDVDCVVLSNIETKIVNQDGILKAEQRNLSHQEFIQWAGRVGRTRPGTVVFCENFCTDEVETETIERFNAMKGIYENAANIELYNTLYTNQRVETSLKVDLPFSMALAFTDNEGLVLMKDEDHIPENMSGKDFKYNKTNPPFLSERTYKGNSVQIPENGFNPNIHNTWMSEYIKFKVDSDKGAHVDLYKHQNRYILDKTFTSQTFIAGTICSLALGYVVYKFLTRSRGKIGAPVTVNIHTLASDCEVDTSKAIIDPAIVLSKLKPEASFDSGDIVYNDTGIIFTNDTYFVFVVKTLLFVASYVLAVEHCDWVHRALIFFGWDDDRNDTEYIHCGRKLKSKIKLIQVLSFTSSGIFSSSNVLALSILSSLLFIVVTRKGLDFEMLLDCVNAEVTRVSSLIDDSNFLDTVAEYSEKITSFTLDVAKSLKSNSRKVAQKFKKIMNAVVAGFDKAVSDYKASLPHEEGAKVKTVKMDFEHSKGVMLNNKAIEDISHKEIPNLDKCPTKLGQSGKTSTSIAHSNTMVGVQGNTDYPFGATPDFDSTLVWIRSAAFFGFVSTFIWQTIFSSGLLRYFKTYKNASRNFNKDIVGSVEEVVEVCVRNILISFLFYIMVTRVNSFILGLILVLDPVSYLSRRSHVFRSVSLRASKMIVGLMNALTIDVNKEITGSSYVRYVTLCEFSIRAVRDAITLKFLHPLLLVERCCALGPEYGQLFVKLINPRSTEGSIRMRGHMHIVNMLYEKLFGNYLISLFSTRARLYKDHKRMNAGCMASEESVAGCVTYHLNNTAMITLSWISTFIEGSLGTSHLGNESLLVKLKNSLDVICNKLDKNIDRICGVDPHGGTDLPQLETTSVGTGFLIGLFLSIMYMVVAVVSTYYLFYRLLIPLVTGLVDNVERATDQVGNNIAAITDEAMKIPRALNDSWDCALNSIAYLHKKISEGIITDDIVALSSYLKNFALLFTTIKGLLWGVRFFINSTSLLCSALGNLTMDWIISMCLSLARMMRVDFTYENGILTSRNTPAIRKTSQFSIHVWVMFISFLSTIITTSVSKWFDYVNDEYCNSMYFHELSAIRIMGNMITLLPSLLLLIVMLMLPFSLLNSLALHILIVSLELIISIILGIALSEYVDLDLSMFLEEAVMASKSNQDIDYIAYLSSGCWADKFLTRIGVEQDHTERLKNVMFDNIVRTEGCALSGVLGQALEDGADLPGNEGIADMITGRIDSEVSLGVNRLKSSTLKQMLVPFDKTQAKSGKIFKRGRVNLSIEEGISSSDVGSTGNTWEEQYDALDDSSSITELFLEESSNTRENIHGVETSISPSVIEDDLVISEYDPELSLTSNTLRHRLCSVLSALLVLMGRSTSFLSGARKINIVCYAINNRILVASFKKGVEIGSYVKTSVTSLFLAVVLLRKGICNISYYVDTGLQLGKEKREVNSKMLEVRRTTKSMRMSHILDNKFKPNYDNAIHLVIALICQPFLLFPFLIVGRLIGRDCDWDLLMAFSLAVNTHILLTPVSAILYVSKALRPEASVTSNYQDSCCAFCLCFTAKKKRKKEKIMVTLLTAFKYSTQLTLDFSVGFSKGDNVGNGEKFPKEIIYPSLGAWQPLPSEFINTRTALMAYVAQLDLLSFKKFKNICSIGTGRGGMLQGLLSDDSTSPNNCSLVSYTLDRLNHQISPKCKYLLDKRGVNLLKREEYINDSLREYDLVLVDTLCNPLNKLDDYGSPMEDVSNWRHSLSTIVSLMAKGQDLIYVTRVSLNRTLINQISVLRSVFTEVTVVLDPMVRGTISCALVCRKLKTGNSITILSSFFDMYNYVVDDHFAENFSKTLTNLETRIRRGELSVQDQSFLPNLARRLHHSSEETKIDILPNEDEKRMTVIYKNSERHIPIREQILTTPSFIRYKANKKTIKSRIGTDHGSYIADSKFYPAPVDDRQHLTGINTVVADILKGAGLLPLPHWYEVPSQSNDMVIAGVKKRYDFPTVGTVFEKCEDAVRFLTAHCSYKARNYDFSPLSWDEVKEVATLKSTAGFMSESSSKNVKDILDNDRVLLNYVASNYLDSSKVNHLFHFSPKVERLLTPPGVVKIPRLFSYKTAEVRLVELSYFKRLNDFMADSSYFPFSYTGDVFKRAEKVCSAFERYKRPLSIQIEASKWDGHKELEWFAISRKFFSDLLLSGKNGSVASEMARSTVWNDGVGTVISCSGHIVSMTRGNQKSGSWDTSCNNKATNSFIALQCVINSLGISAEEAFRRVTILIEGDDGLIVGEENDIIEISKSKDQFYAQCGFPQEVETGLVSSPEDTMFCSMGSTRLDNGICVPVRGLDEIFGKSLVSLANKQIGPTYENYARCLSVICSMAAMYWHDPVVRKMYKLCKQMIPEDVNARAAHSSERFQFVNLLGNMNPKTFNMEQWVRDTLGVEIPEYDMRNDKAIKRMSTDKYRCLLDLEPNLIPRNTLSVLSNRESYEVLWIDNEITDREVYEMVEDRIEHGIICVETHQRALTTILSNYSFKDWAITSGTYKEAIRRFRTPVLSLVTGETKFQRMKMLVSSRSSLRREKCVSGSCRLYLRKELCMTTKVSKKFDSELIKTNGTHFLIFSSVAFVVLIWVWFKTLDVRAPINTPHGTGQCVVTTRAVVEKGFTVESGQDGVITSLPQFRTIVPEPVLADSIPVDLIYPLFLAISNFCSRYETFSLDRRSLVRDINALMNWERRFGLVIGSPEFQNPLITTVYKSNFSNNFHLLDDYRGFIDKVNAADDLNFANRKVYFPNFKKAERMQPHKWTINGSMLTAHKWYGTTRYGQIDRIEDMLRRVKISNKGQFILRISDLYMLEKDGIYGNRYYFPKGQHTGTLGGYLILGESQGPNSRDIARPYGCDWSNRKLQRTKAGLFNGLVFRGGPTGPGFNEKYNVRIQLISRAPSEIDGTKIDVGFNRGHARLRIDESGNIGNTSATVYNSRSRKEKIELNDMMNYKYVLVIEGNEAPDRVLTLLGGLGLVILVEATHVKSSQSWIWTLLSSDEYLCVNVKPSWLRISDVISFFNKNEKLRREIVDRANRVSSVLRRDDTMIGYIQNVISLSHHVSFIHNHYSSTPELVSTEHGYRYEVSGKPVGSLSIEKKLINSNAWELRIYVLRTSDLYKVPRLLENESFLKHIANSFKKRSPFLSHVRIYVGDKMRLAVAVWTPKFRVAIMNYVNNTKIPHTVLCSISNDFLEFNDDGGLKTVAKVDGSFIGNGKDGELFTDCHVEPTKGKKEGVTWVPQNNFLYRVKLGENTGRHIMLQKDMLHKETSKNTIRPSFLVASSPYRKAIINKNLIENSINYPTFDVVETNDLTRLEVLTKVY